MNPTPSQWESANVPGTDWKERADEFEAALNRAVDRWQSAQLGLANLRVADEATQAGLAAAEEELDRLRRQNQAMREALEWQHHECHTCHPGEQCPDVCVCSCPQCHMEHIKRNALKDDAGSTLLTREQVMPLVEGLQNYEGSMWDCEAANVALSHARTLGLIEKETP